MQRPRTGRLAGFALLALGCAKSPDGRAGGDRALVVRDAFAPQPVVAGDPASASMAAYFVVDNSGPADTLDAITTPAAAKAAVHADMDHGGMRSMMPVDHFAVPATGSLALAPGALHVMLEQLASVPRAGDTIALSLRFRHAGTVDVMVPVIPYTALDSALDARGRHP